MQNKIYPLKFTPIFTEKIWGGDAIKKYFENAPDGKVGEAWLLSDVPGSETPVANGFLQGKSIQEVIESYSEEIFGKRNSLDTSGRFPLLFKVIDAHDDLSVQVHPDDDLALIKHNSPGKTEMWYVLDHEPDASLIAGFKKETDQEHLRDALQNGTALDLLNQVPVQQGDCFFIPAGRVHAIGKGIQVVEVQQTSDVTYRVYDFERVDDQGTSRELHLEDAEKVMNYRDCDSGLVKQTEADQECSNLITCPHFKTDLLELNAGREFVVKTDDSWIVLLSLSGKCNVETQNSSDILNLYDVLLVPSVFDEVKIKTESVCRLLVVN